MTLFRELIAMDPNPARKTTMTSTESRIDGRVQQRWREVERKFQDAEYRVEGTTDEGH